MKLDHFHYLLEVNRHHSISAAARKLKINQTTLSAMIKSVEEEIGFPVFQRTSGGVVATSAGDQFLRLAWEIELQHEKLMELKRRTSDGAPAITILLSTTIAGKLAIPLLDRFYQFGLPANLSLEESPSEVTAEKIQNHRANIGIAFLTQASIAALNRRGDSEMISVEILMEDQLRLIVSEKHPLANAEIVSVPYISSGRLATIKPRQNDDMILGYLRHVFPNVTCFSRWDPFLRAIRDQGLVGFVPSFSWDDHTCARCKLVPIKDTERENRLYLCLLTCKGRKLRHQEEVLIQCIREYFQEFNPGRREAQS